ncbi:MAG: hypothetical protein L6Q99_00550 [Planctomycetes bacterium]|nr:hypothetical protein [Planctomycetota bacterium]
MLGASERARSGASSGRTGSACGDEELAAVVGAISELADLAAVVAGAPGAGLPGKVAAAVAETIGPISTVPPHERHFAREWGNEAGIW